MEATGRIWQYQCGRIGIGIGLLAGLMIAMRGGAGKLLFCLGAFLFWTHILHWKIHPWGFLKK